MNRITFLLLLVMACACGNVFAQNAKIAGVVLDAVTGEPLIGASVVYAPGKGGVTDFDGKFTITDVPNGTYQLVISYIGFTPDTQQVVLNDKQVYIESKLATQRMKEVMVTADVAKSRETPIAFTNVSVQKIEEELGSRDIPMLLMTTPGVYASQQGGGDGDARITIRGFNQQNVAVMIDGVPVNDMENGQVFWSNWNGLDIVTRSIQVQRGLGASKLALPSVGGTLNLMTKGIESKSQVTLSQTMGDDLLSQTSFALTTGRLNKGWGVSVAGSYKQRNGWVDGTWFKGGFYYMRVDKAIGDKHMISLIGYGGPQKHGQTAFKKPISYYDKEYAAGLFEGTDAQYEAYARGEFDGDSARLMENFIDTTGVTGYDLRHNDTWGYINRYSINANGDTVRGNDDKQNLRLNYYHKPQVSLRYSFSPNEKLYWSTVVYGSIGKGGGTANDGGGVPRDSTGQVLFNGNYNFRTGIYDLNYNNIDLSIDSTQSKATTFIRASTNDHYWFGGLSTLEYEFNNTWSLSGGVDIRSYRGVHQQKVYDLLGGDYMIDPDGNPNELSNQKKVVGDIIGRDYLGLVNWGGLFAQAEFTKGHWNAFLNATVSGTGYKRIDYWRMMDIVLEDTILRESVDYNTNVVYNGTEYTMNSPEARNSQTDWTWIPGYTFKAGVNYNINENHNIFVNGGYLNKAPRFNNVIYSNNTLLRNSENEMVRAVELGYTAKYTKFVSNLNLYYTNWLNTPLDFTPTIPDPEDPDRRLAYNINGLDAVHMGVELDFAWNILKNVTLEGVFSYGDWRYNSKDSVPVYDDQGNLVTSVVYDAKGVHRPDAPQVQVGGSIRYEPIKNFYIKVQTIFFAKQYSNFDPASLNGVNAGRDSWKVPNYNLLNLYLGYRFKISKVNTILQLNVQNVLNAEYISDAQNNDSFTQNYDEFNARSASAYMGTGIRVTGTIKFQIQDFIKKKK
jgi:iron complex outermembrane receptor protein